MPIPVWPSALQQLINTDSFTLKTGDTLLRSDVDTGPIKVRRRFTKQIDTMTCAIWVTIAEYTTFDNFFNIEVNGGATSFYFDHPITGVQTLVRFTSPPEYRPLSSVQFVVSFSLEILP